MKLHSATPLPFVVKTFSIWEQPNSTSLLVANRTGMLAMLGTDGSIQWQVQTILEVLCDIISVGSDSIWLAGFGGVVQIDPRSPNACQITSTVEKNFYSGAYSELHNVLFAGGEEYLWQIDLSLGLEINKMAIPEGFTGVAMHPDENYLVFGIPHVDESIIMLGQIGFEGNPWGERVFRIPFQELCEVGFSRSGEYLVFATHSDVCLLNFPKAQVVACIRGEEFVEGADLYMKDFLRGDSRWFTNVIVDDAVNEIYYGDVNGRLFRANWVTRKITNVSAHEKPVWQLALSKDRQYLFSLGADNVIKSWEL